jgi:hypothetical protein
LEAPNYVKFRCKEQITGCDSVAIPGNLHKLTPPALQHHTLRGKEGVRKNDILNESSAKIQKIFLAGLFTFEEPYGREGGNESILPSEEI